MRIETLPSALSGKYQPKLLRGQFVLAKRPEIIPETWRQDSLSGWILATHPSLPVAPIVGREGVSHGWVIGYAIDPHGRVVEREGIALSSVSSGTLASLHERLAGFGGRYILVLLDGPFQRVYLDPCGTLGTVYSPIEEVVASTSFLIPYSNATCDNIGLQKALRMPFNHSTGYPVGLTPRHQVKRLLPNHYLDLANWEPKRFWPQGELAEGDAETAVGAIVDILKTQLGAIFAHDSVQLSLTAGGDSRVLLACAKKYAQEMELYTVEIPRDVTCRVDVRISGSIARRLGLKHRILRHQDASVSDFEEWLYKTGCEVSAERGWQTVRTIKQLRPDRVAIVGSGGELTRDFWWRKEDSPSSPMTLERLARQCGAPLIPEVRMAFQAWLDSLPPISSFLTILHLFYIEQRLGCWAGVMPYGEAHSTFDILPYSHRRIIELMLSLPVNYKRERRFWKDVVEREWPDLLLFPVNPRSRFEVWEERTRLGLSRVARGLRNPKATIRRIAQRSASMCAIR